jgi:hypothetical protein
MENRVQGQDRGLILNKQPVATFHTPRTFFRREEHINVAQGMDISLAVGVAIARYDKQAEDSVQAQLAMQQ